MARWSCTVPPPHRSLCRLPGKRGKARTRHALWRTLQRGRLAASRHKIQKPSPVEARIWRFVTRIVTNGCHELVPDAIVNRKAQRPEVRTKILAHAIRNRGRHQRAAKEISRGRIMGRIVTSAPIRAPVTKEPHQPFGGGTVIQSIHVRGFKELPSQGIKRGIGLIRIGRRIIPRGKFGRAKGYLVSVRFE